MATRDSTDRFERTPEAGGSKVASAPFEVCEYLARLWARFGPADRIDGGFSYRLRDRKTGLTFEAYSGASGPSYGGDPREKRALTPVLAVFERLLAETAPVDCAHTLTEDIEYGGAVVTIGWRDGAPFTETHDDRTPPSSAATAAECVAIAKEYEGGYGAMAGWQHCLDAVLPQPPEELRWNGVDWENPVGFAFDDDDEPSMLYIGEEGSPQPVPLSAITFDPPLPAIARLWLQAFASWKRSDAVEVE